MTPPNDETSRAAQRAAARYVAELVLELVVVARSHHLDTLGYLLEVARLEAESISRSRNGRGP
jgi:hypothetical protein